MGRKQNLNDMKKVPYYYYEGEEVVLLSPEEVAEFNLGITPVYDDGDNQPYPLTDEVRKLIEEDKLSVYVSYDDSYDGCFNRDEPTEIDFTSVRNIENKQKMMWAWVTVEYARLDEAERELCVTTDRYYDWTSERSKMVKQIKKVDDEQCEYDIAQELLSLQEEWEEVVANYPSICDSMFISEDDYSFKSLLNEVGGCIAQLDLDDEIYTSEEEYTPSAEEIEKVIAELRTYEDPDPEYRVEQYEIVGAVTDGEVVLYHVIGDNGDIDMGVLRYIEGDTIFLQWDWQEPSAPLHLCEVKDYHWDNPYRRDTPAIIFNGYPRVFM